jgi:hypothetical protein
MSLLNSKLVVSFRYITDERTARPAISGDDFIRLGGDDGQQADM